MLVFMITGTVECNDQKYKPESRVEREGKMIENIDLGIMQTLAKAWLGKKKLWLILGR